ncbi:hypothetical protein [Actinoplanes sp. HUAS TT8]|uniref:hypothetical protein n=1 Tax=Actinoplanes sp. HUAS TT8 TaxID=3447453 RepID=UPI003F5276E6
MRLIKPVLGMMLLTIGLPALLAGGCLWVALRHRDAGGAYSAELQRLSTSGYAIVVPDVDRLLRDDAKFARIGDTELRITALTSGGPAFVGLAPSEDVADYLQGVALTEVTGVQVGTGELPITTTRIEGRRALPSGPGLQDIWYRTGGGALRWTPGEVTGNYSLVIMNADGARGIRLNGTVEARPGWLDPAAWGLLSLGAILLMAGVIVLTLPSRRREIVYVVEPSQVPDLMRAIGAPLPLRALEAPALPGGGRRSFDAATDFDQVPGFGPGGLFGFGPARKRGAHRPRTLADSEPSRPPALPQFAWPPTNPDGGTAGDSLPVSPISSGTSIASGPSGGNPTASGTTMTAAPTTAIRPNGLTPVVPGALPIPAPTSPSPSRSAEISAPGAQTPAPGTPLSLLGETPAVTTETVAQPAARPARRRADTPADIPEFHATAVGAWVAKTAPERARQTEARAAAALAEAARTRAAKLTPADQLIRSAADPTSGDQPTPADPKPAADDKSRPSDSRRPSGEAGDKTGPAGKADPEGETDPDRSGDNQDTAGKHTADQDRQSPKRDGVTRRRSVWPAPVPRRVALLTGPNATDWSATGMTRMGGSRPSPKPASETPATDLNPPKTSAAQGVARVAAASGTTKVESAPAYPDPVLVPAQSIPASDAPTEPIENIPAADAPTEPLENRPAADAPTQPIGKDAVGEVPGQAVEKVAASEEVRPETVSEQKTMTTPETEKREESKPPIVPFPTRQPSKPVPSARTAEPRRPSLHEVEAAETQPEPESSRTSEPGTSALTPKQPEADTIESTTERPSIHQAEAAPTTQPAKPSDSEPAGDAPADAAPSAEGPVAPAAPADAADEQAMAGQVADDQVADEQVGAVQGPVAEVAEATVKPAAKPATKRADQKRTTEPNRPLSRAQDRLSGTTPGRQPGSATTRKAPAAWIKAAETVAARAAAEETDASTSPSAADTPPAADTPAPTGTPPATETPAARKPRPRTARPAAEKPAAKPSTTKSVPEQTAPKSAPEQAAPNAEPDTELKADAKAEARTEFQADAQAESKAGSEADSAAATTTEADMGTTKPSPRTPSYREEAAELLGSGTEPKRRRTVTRRPKDTPNQP